MEFKDNSQANFKAALATFVIGGADVLLPSDEDTLRVVLEEVGPRRVDAVIDFVGMKATMEMACYVKEGANQFVLYKTTFRQKQFNIFLS